MYFLRFVELFHAPNCLEQGLALQTWVLRGFSLVKWVFMGYLGVLPVECVLLCDFPRVTMYFMRIGELLHETNCLEQGLALQIWVLRGFSLVKWVFMGYFTKYFTRSRYAPVYSPVYSPVYFPVYSPVYFPVYLTMYFTRTRYAPVYSPMYF